MKTHQILCRHTGEYSHTAKDPVAVWTGQVDLTEKQDCILNSDDWRPWTVDRWEIREVELPDWLEPQEWIRNTVSWKYLWGMGADRDWPESWQRAIIRMNAAEKLACIKLLKVKNFRSEFRASLRQQLELWIAGDRRYDTPFSHRQWDVLLQPQLVREADSIDRYLYRSGR